MKVVTKREEKIIGKGGREEKKKGDTQILDLR